MQEQLPIYPNYFTFTIQIGHLVKKTVISITLILLFSGITNYLLAQIMENKKSFDCLSHADTIKFDSLISIPSSIVINDRNNLNIDTEFYHIDNINSIIIFHKNLPDSIFPITIKYKTLPFKLNESYYNRKLIIDNENTDSVNADNQFYEYNEIPASSSISNLNKSGSIVRGITMGTNKNASVQSAFDLKLEGNLNEDFNIKAYITDKNVPYQPEGNTQQLQEFDKVFINLYNDNTSIIAGDYDLSAQSGYFFKLNKKNQGLWMQHQHKLKNKKVNNTSRATHTLSGAISKGKYIQKILEIRDGIQGPYKLSGINNELYIIIIAGSENIYMDGVLLTRGAENDYVIDYNTAEITFTAKHTITKNLRIVAEYEYSDKTYARTAFYGSNELNTRKIEFKVSYYSEQDLKNQPLTGTITDRQKDFMRNITNNNSVLAFPGIDSTGFSEDMVMYKMVSKTINGITYDSVFEYSVNKDSAYYKLSFSYVGRGNGNYVQIRNQANGRIFEWVRPINGIKQGDYEPVLFINTPQQHQLANLLSTYHLTKNDIFINEIAVSNKDINTFSNKNNHSNQGYAIKNQFVKKIPLTDSLHQLWNLNIAASQLYINNNFKTPEPFRDVEYNRSWGLKTPISFNQNDYKLAINITNKNNNKIGILSNFNQLQSNYEGLKNGYILQIYPGKTAFESDGSLLKAKDSLNNITLLRNNLHIRHHFKLFTIGTINLFETNKSKIKNNNNYSINSYENNENKLYISNADTSMHFFSLQYSNRTYKSPFYNKFRNDNTNNIASLNYKINNIDWTALDLLFSYRESKIFDTTNRMIDNDFGILSKIEHQLNWKKIPFTFYTSIENSSMMEVRYDYSFVEVGTGMGNYIWNDYNNNKIKELYEFEISPIQSEANYIKMLLPTNGYIKVYQTAFSETINAAFPQHWRKATKIRRLLYRFSDQLNLHYHKKTSSDNWNDAYNPFNFQLADSLLKSGRKFIRNTVFFNRNSQQYAAEFTYETQQNKMLLIDGSEEIFQEWYNLKNRVSITRNLQIEHSISQRSKEKRSSLFQLKNFTMLSYETTLKLNFQPNNTLRIAPFGSMNRKQGSIQNLDIKTNSNAFGIECKWSQLLQSSVMAKVSYISIKTTANINNPLLFEMIEIFKPGDNYIWNVIYQKTLNKSLQISLTYDGRAAPNTTTIHIGNIQLRAFF